MNIHIPFYEYNSWHHVRIKFKVKSNSFPSTFFLHAAVFRTSNIFWNLFQSIRRPSFIYNINEYEIWLKSWWITTNGRWIWSKKQEFSIFDDHLQLHTQAQWDKQQETETETLTIPRETRTWPDGTLVCLNWTRTCYYLRIEPCIISMNTRFDLNLDE